MRAEGVGVIADAVLERWFAAAFCAEHPEVVEWSGNMLRNTPSEGYAGCCEAIRDAALSGRLGAISAPTLVITGSDDPAAPPDQAELIHASIPDARLVVLRCGRKT